jgi:hypothetical protein
VVLIALSNGLAVEALPDPDAVPDDLLARVLADLVDPEQPWTTALVSGASLWQNLASARRAPTAGVAMSTSSTVRVPAL